MTSDTPDARPISYATRDKARTYVAILVPAAAPRPLPTLDPPLRVLGRAPVTP